MWILDNPLSVTLPDSYILIPHNWLQRAFDSSLFSISEDRRCHRRRERALPPELKQRVNLGVFDILRDNHPQLPRKIATCATLSRLSGETPSTVCFLRIEVVATNIKSSALFCYPANSRNGDPHTSRHRLSTNRRARFTTRT